MHIIQVTSSMFVLVKKGDNPNLRRMEMKHQKETTKKDNNLHKSKTDVPQTALHTHVDIKSSRPLFIFFPLVIFTVHTHYLHLPAMYFSDITAAIPDITENTYGQFIFHCKSIVSRQLIEDICV